MSAGAGHSRQGGLIPVEEALALTLALAPPLRTETVPLAAAFGRVLAAPVAAGLDQPPFDAASMDGYAIRSADLGLPFLTVAGEAAAGRPWSGPAAPGTALRIFTGAPVPEGFDRVIMQENVTREGEGEGAHIRIANPGGGDNIRRRGNDFRKGDVVAPGRRLSAIDLGLIAAMNCAEVTVAARPVVAILPGGDELVPPGTAPGAGQIINSNDIAVAALVTGAGGIPRILPIARDTVASVTAGLGAAAAEADLVVTIGGASVGDHDLIAGVTEAMGMERAFYKIAMRPGKPLVAGRLGRAALLGLPGNPVSAITCAMLFMQPLLRRMQGLAGDDVAPQPLPAVLAGDLPPEGPRQHYLRASLTPRAGALPLIAPHPDQDSARLGVMADADALLIRPAGDPARKAGEAVGYLPLRPQG